MSREAEIAAAWWADKLRPVAKDPSRVDAFAESLERWLDGRIAAGEHPVPLTTSDCGPQLHLGDHAASAHLIVGSMLWPQQAAMWVAPGSVYVHEGYNSLRQTLYP